MMKATELVSKAIDIAKNYKTLYVMGCFGAPMTAANKKRYTTNHSYNKAAARVKMINAASEDTFGFVCVLSRVSYGAGMAIRTPPMAVPSMPPTMSPILGQTA